MEWAYSNLAPCTMSIDILGENLHHGNTGPILTGKVKRGGQSWEELSELSLLFFKINRSSIYFNSSSF